MKKFDAMEMSKPTSWSSERGQPPHPSTIVPIYVTQWLHLLIFAQWTWPNFICCRPENFRISYSASSARRAWFLALGYGKTERGFWLSWYFRISKNWSKCANYWKSFNYNLTRLVPICYGVCLIFLTVQNLSLNFKPFHWKISLKLNFITYQD